MAIDKISILLTLKDKMSPGLAGIGGLLKQVGKLGMGIAKAGLVAFAGAVTGAAIGMKKSIDAAIEFEKQMANVSTMLDETSMKRMPEFESGIREMSKQFGESTDTLSKGLYDILSASVAPEKAMGVLEASAKAARGGLTDTGTAADAITTIMNAYGYSADQAGEISDKLFAIVKRGKTTFGALAPNIGKVASTAAIAGLSFEETGASIATLTRAGIKTEEAMTAINGIIRAFMKPGDDAKEMAKQFGFEMSTATLQSEGLVSVLQKLNGATAEQLAVISPNIRGLKGFAAGMGNVKGQASDLALMMDSAGLAQEAFSKQTDTMDFQMQKMKQTFTDMGVSIGQQLLPPLNNIITKFVEWMQGPGGQKALETIKTLMSNLMPIFESIAGFIGNIAMKGTEFFGDFVSNLGPAFNSIIEFMKEIFGSFMETANFDMLKETATNFIGVIQENMPRIKEIFNSIAKVIGHIFNIFGKIIQILIDSGALDLIIMTFQNLSKVLETVFGWISKLIDGVSELVRKIADSKFGKFVGGAVSGAQERMTGFLDKLTPDRKVGDFILRPNGEVIETSPQDTIMGAKGAMPGSGMVINIGTVQGLDADSVAVALQDTLSDMVNY